MYGTNLTIIISLVFKTSIVSCYKYYIFLFKALFLYFVGPVWHYDHSLGKIELIPLLFVGLLRMCYPAWFFFFTSWCQREAMLCNCDISWAFFFNYFEFQGQYTTGHASKWDPFGRNISLPNNVYMNTRGKDMFVLLVLRNLLYRQLNYDVHWLGNQINIDRKRLLIWFIVMKVSEYTESVDTLSPLHLRKHYGLTHLCLASHKKDIGRKCKGLIRVYTICIKYRNVYKAW